jgi:hypothetical protein
MAYYILCCANQDKKSFFTCQDKKSFQSAGEQIFEVEKKTAKMKSVLSKD